MSLIKVNNRSLGTGTVTHGVLPAGTVLSVNSARKVDTFSMSATSFADVPGLSVTVTPKSASSKFLVSASICCGNDWWHANNYFGIYEGGTTVGGDGTQPWIYQFGANDANAASEGDQFYDEVLRSPNTTSPITYKVVIASTNGSYAATVNRMNSAATKRGASFITVREIQG